jgi:hypothetical protein
LDVPDDFFTMLLPTLSLFLAVSKAVARSRLEERAWEQRLEEAREEKMNNDASLSEIDVRRTEAAKEWSAYGRTTTTTTSTTQNKTFNNRRVMMTREQTLQQEEDSRKFQMSQEEIQQLKQDFGVDYDPYYDDPYTQEELPDNVPYKVDKVYGDVIYRNGEVFYKHADSGLYYRQGSQPRSRKLW